MGMNGQGVPLLGMQKGRSGASVMGIARSLDENGTFASMIVTGPGGQPVGVADRESYLDAEELVALIREAVREVVREEVADDRYARLVAAAEKAVDPLRNDPNYSVASSDAIGAELGAALEEIHRRGNAPSP